MREGGVEALQSTEYLVWGTRTYSVAVRGTRTDVFYGGTSVLRKEKITRQAGTGPSSPVTPPGPISPVTDGPVQSQVTEYICHGVLP